MKRLLPFTLLLLFLGFIISIPFILQPDSQRVPLADYLSSRLGYRVQIARLDASFLPPTLRLHEVTVWRGPNQPLLEVQLIEAKPNWGSLFHGQIAPKEITFKKWGLSIRRRADASWDWDSWIKAAGSWSGKDHWPIQAIHWNEGTIRFMDPFAAVPQELTIQSVEGALDKMRDSLTLSGTLGGVAHPESIAIQAQGRFIGSPQWSGDLRFGDEGRAWVIRVDQKEGKTEMLGQSAQWRFDHALALLKFYLCRPARTLAVAAPPFLQDWKTRVSIGGNRVSFSHQGILAGGPTEAKGEILMEPGRAASLRIQAAAQDVDLVVLGPVVDGAYGFEGKFTAVVSQFELPLSSAPWANLQAKASAEIREGHYRFPAASLPKLMKTKTMGYFKKQYPNMLETGLPFAKARIQLGSQQGMVSLENGWFTSGKIRAGLVGKFDIVKEGLDAYARLLIPGSPLRQGRIQGTLKEWSLRALPSRKIPAAIQSKLRRALNQK